MESHHCPLAPKTGALLLSYTWMNSSIGDHLGAVGAAGDRASRRWESNPSRRVWHTRLSPSTACASPTLWNRTRTSRPSIERADHLRQSGISRCAPCGTRSACHWVLASTLIVIALQLSQIADRSPAVRRAHLGPRCVRAARGHTCRESRYGVLTPRLGRKARVVGCGASGDVSGGALCAARNVEGPPGFPGGPSARVID